MNYQKHYDTLIARGQRTLIHGYREKHHIIPNCMGGTNKKDNLVWLTAEEHYTAHLLLVKIYPDSHKLIFAANMMCVDRYGHRTNNKRYGWLKRLKAEASSRSQKAKKRGPMKEETKKKLSEATKGRTAVNKGLKIGPTSKDRKAKISFAKSGRRFTCCKCCKEYGATCHFTACKSIFYDQTGIL